MNNTLNTVGQWVTKLGGNDRVIFRGTATDSSNNYIAVGDARNTSGNNDEALIAKFDADGNLLWQKKLSGSSNNYFYGITTDSSNNYIAVGNEKNSTSNYEALIAKFDTDGNLLWQKKLGGSNGDSFYGTATDSSNNYVAVGDARNTSGDKSEALIAKFDTDGTLLWQKKLGDSNNEYFNGITTDSSNNYIAVGNEYSSTSGDDYEALIAKFDSDGNLLWQKKLGHSYFNGITTDSSNNYIAVGREKSTNGNTEALIAKFDTNGTIVTDALTTTPQLSLKDSALTLSTLTLT